MKMTSFFDSSAFVFRTIKGLAAAVLVATALLFVRPLRAESAAAKVNGQISVILEGWIDGEDAFIFRDGKVSIQHKSFKVPYEITVNGKKWTDLSKPFELGFTPDPATTKFTCEGRGTSSLTHTDDSVIVSVYDQQGAATRYRIILFQPSGVKSPLVQPKKPIDKTVKEIPTGSTLASQPNTGGAESAAAKRDSVSTQPIDRNNEDTTIETVTTTEENDDTIVQTTVVTETKNGKVVKKTTTTTTTTKEKPTSKNDAKPTSSGGTSATKTSSSSETDSSTTKKITNPFGTTQRPVEDDE